MPLRVRFPLYLVILIAGVSAVTATWQEMQPDAISDPAPDGQVGFSREGRPRIVVDARPFRHLAAVDHRWAAGVLALLLGVSVLITLFHLASTATDVGTE